MARSYHMAHRNGRTNAQLIAHLRYLLRAAEHGAATVAEHWKEQRNENILLKGRITNLENMNAGLQADLRGDVCTIDDLRTRLQRTKDEMQDMRESYNKAFRELEASYHKLDDELKTARDANINLRALVDNQNDQRDDLIGIAGVLARTLAG